MSEYNKYISQYTYYENNGNIPSDANWGSYQYVSLKDIVNNFMLIYNDNHLFSFLILLFL